MIRKIYRRCGSSEGNRTIALNGRLSELDLNPSSIADMKFEKFVHPVSTFPGCALHRPAAYAMHYNAIMIAPIKSCGCRKRKHGQERRREPGRSWRSSA
jgi:hypothetical protein